MEQLCLDLEPIFNDHIFQLLTLPRTCNVHVFAILFPCFTIGMPSKVTVRHIRLPVYLNIKDFVGRQMRKVDILRAITGPNWSECEADCQCQQQRETTPVDLIYESGKAQQSQ